LGERRTGDQPNRRLRVMRVLIVEDDEASLVLARRLIEHMGHTVLTATDGLEALATAEATRPDLLLLDLRIPKLAGLDVVRALRRDRLFETMSIIAVSADVGADDRALAISAGCDDFVAKPYQPADLRAAVRRRET
jgi:CheY-like chemotaxis protein